MQRAASPTLFATATRPEPTVAGVRPMLRVATAMALGTVVGRWELVGELALALALAALLGAGVVWVWLGPRGDVARRPAALALVLIGLVSALRLQPVGHDDLLGEHGHGEERLGASPVIRGGWSPTSQGEHGEFGRVVDRRGVGWRVVMPAGTAWPGEQLELTPVERPFRPARGAAPAPLTPGALDSIPMWRVRADEVRRVAAAPWSISSGSSLRRLRQLSIARCERFGGDAAAFARALLFGDETRIRTEIADLFTRTGVRHILAVSGMHVALLAAFLALALGDPARSRSRSMGALATLLLIAVYSVLSGAQAPVRRAALTVALATIAVGLGRRREAASWRRADPINLLATALALELAVAPRTLFSISLQLSYCATAGLILGAGPLARWVGARRRVAVEALAAQLARHAIVGRLAAWGIERVGAGARLRATGPWRALSVWLAKAFDTACGASIAATLATAPLCWIALGEFSPIGLVATPWVGPLIAWLLAYGLAAVYLPLPAEGFAVPYEALIATLTAFDVAPASPLPLPPRPWWLLLIAALGMLAWTSRRRPRLAEHGRRVAAAAWGVALLPWSLAPLGLEVRALDVGHGTAIAVRTASNGVWLFDAGTRDRYGLERAALGPQLAAWAPGSIGVIVSHTDRDHTSALRWVADRWPVHSWIGAVPDGLSPRHSAATRRWSPSSGPLELVDAPGELRITVLPGATGWRAGENERSLAAVFRAHGHALVLTGDAVGVGIDEWLADDALPAAAALLVWPHHGDPSQRASELLAACAPQLVWISASRPGGIEPELERSGVEWDATYRSGPLTLRLPRAPP